MSTEDKTSVDSTASMNVVFCCICLEEDIVESTAFACNGTNEQHYMCRDCFLGYLHTELAVNGKFDSCVQNDPEVFSPPGSLPCPRFGDDCDCTAMALTTLYRVMSSDAEVAEAHYMAVQRVHRRNLPSQTSSSAKEDEVADVDPVDQVRLAVEDALNEGYVTKCPSCDQPGYKDDACMHIKCGRCSTRFCYCCGRKRRDASEQERCRGCDADNIFIENQPGGIWSQFAIGNETLGYGALWEFQRRRQAYLVRLVKEAAPPGVWQAFRLQYPNVLDNKPTDGRRITWDELETALPPVFGRSQQEDLLWVQNVQFADRVRELSTNGQTETEDSEAPPQEQAPQEDEHPPQPQPWSQILKSTGGLLWIIGVLVSGLLLVVRWAAPPNDFLRAFGDLSVSVVSFFGFRCFLLWWSDYCAANPDHTFVRDCTEVQFCGTPMERPFLSSTGRWGDIRRPYMTWLISCIASGSFLVGNASRLGGIGPACHIVGTMVLTFTVTGQCLLGWVVNHRPPPQHNETFKSFVASVGLYVAILSLGAGLKASPSDDVQSAGLVLILLGVACLLAEFSIRIASMSRTPLWAIPAYVDKILSSYSFFVGLFVGSALLSLGVSYGIIALIIVGSLMLTGGLLFACFFWNIIEEVD